MTDGSQRAVTARGQPLEATPNPLRELAASIPCDRCDSSGLCAGCKTLVALIEAEIRLRQHAGGG